MALKLGKCRLCLKLGDFYSIFTVDNNLQLSEMVMECTRVKIYEGDGLPDKVCSECIQKLSSAHIFKQQCERADEELRRNYVPPPGFNSPPPPNRQSSDSAFSNHTDISNKPSSSNDNKITAGRRNRKRSKESIDNTSISSRSQDYRSSSSKRVDELRKSHKRPRIQSENTSTVDSDYDDNSFANYSHETDSDEPLAKDVHTCKTCKRQFPSLKSLAIHMRAHKKDMPENAVVDIPKKNIEDAADIEDKLSCEKCGKTFKLKIMLKRHYDSCGKTQVSPRKELLISLEPIDNITTDKTLVCEYCSTKFKAIENLEKHLRVVHAAVLKKKSDTFQPKVENDDNTGKVTVPCLYCRKPFNDYYLHSVHFNSCHKKVDDGVFECHVCQKVMSKKASYFLHIKNMHFEARVSSSNSTREQAGKEDSFECRMCSKKLATQELLITHLEAHMSNMGDEAPDEESRAATPEDTSSVHSEYNSCSVSTGPLKCSYCDRRFKYKRALETHESLKHSQAHLQIKTEPSEKASTSLNDSRYRNTDSESSQDEVDDNTCDICEKQFSYKRLLLHHKRTKHNMSSGTKRAKIVLKDCLVRCLICDIEMKVSESNEHNLKHMAANIKPRNLYTCIDCGVKVKSCSALASHIKLIHRLKQQETPLPLQFEGDLADFCEVVVTKSEPLDDVQCHNDQGEVPSENDATPLVNLSGFTCPMCGKKMGTLISLKRHMNWHSNVGNNIEKIIECFVCKETFRFKGHYRLHMRSHYNDPNLDPKLLTCTICNRKSKHLRAAQAHMNYHKQTRFKNKDYQCAICKRIFQYRKVYLSHMAIHYKRGESIQNTIVGDCLPNSADRSLIDGSNTCQHCGKVCDSEVSLKHHITWHKSKTSLYGARHECPMCNLQFTNKRRQELHLRTHYEDDNGPYKCEKCGKGFIDEDYYRRHLKGHNFDHEVHKKRVEKLRKDKVKCPICIRYYPDLVKLIRHLKFTHPESKMIKQDPDAPPPRFYSCKLCAKRFMTERSLQSHEERHLRKPEFFKCKFCGIKTMSLKSHRIHIKSHLVRKYLDDPLKCPQCEETFVKGYDLHYHLRDAHGVNETWIEERSEQTLDGPLKELQCSVCYKVLASKGNYERHIDYHNSLRCNYCFEYFTASRFMEGHLAFSCEKRKIIGDTVVYPKKVKCHMCYKAFALQVKLDCHLRTQHDIKVSKEASEGKKDIICDYCFREFENEYALAGHKIYHRTIGYYGCIYCNRKFNTLTLYKKHKNHHFSQMNFDNPTKCEHCDETFVPFREMIYHMRDVHGDDKEWIIMPKNDKEEKCNICNKMFFNLHRHLDYHEANRCKKCGEYFYSRSECDNHLCSIESDEERDTEQEYGQKAKYEECEFCFKPITRKNSKRLHDNLHKVSGAISCRFCNHKFKTIDAFNIHAWSHRNRKYTTNPLKCRNCGEKFVKYGPFIKHMRLIHKSTRKMHYRTIVKAETCVVCERDFPNLHNHYRAHLQNQCQLCRKYFTSSKLFSMHQCDKEDTDTSKVYTSDENLKTLINAYIPKDEKDDEKFYGYEEKEGEYVTPTFEGFHDEESQNSQVLENDHFVGQPPVISDVLSLYQKKDDPSNISKNDDKVITLTDDESMDVNETCPTIITIDD